MDGFDIELNGLPTSTMTGDTEIGSLQFTNNLDEVLRDGSGNPIRLVPSDYRHQAYYGEEKRHTYSGKIRKYVYKQGIIVEMYDHCDGVVRNY